MKKNLLVVLCLFFILLITSCLSVPASATTTGSRTLILDNNTISELDTDNGFTAWFCKDYVYGGKVLVEVGYFDINGERYGFILYDGGYTGEITTFYRDGLHYRWDWGKDNEYSFVIKTDGVGLYYDFSSSKDGTAKPREVYSAYKRYSGKALNNQE